MKRFIVLCLAFVACSAGASLIGQLPDGSRGVGYIWLHFVLSALMFAAVAWFPAGTRAVSWLVATGVAARVVVFLSLPYTSNDAFRYLWDGHVLLAGGDPWVQSPQAILASDWPLPPDNRDIASLYPPLAMGLFWVAASGGVSASLWLWKGMVLLASIGGLLGVVRLVGGRPEQRWLPLVALSPLLVLETGVGAHLDVIVALTLVLALVAWRRGAMVVAGVFLGAGVLLKFLPLVVFIPLIIASGRRASRAVATGAIAVVGVGYGVALCLGLAPLGSLVPFLVRWRFGTPVAFAESVVGPAFAVGLSAVLLSFFLGLSAVQARRKGLESSLALALMAPLVAGPVAFPWYLSPVVAVSAFNPSAVVVTWATLAPLTYEVIDTYRLTGQFRPASWPMWLTVVGLLVAAAFDVRRAVRQLRVDGPRRPDSSTRRSKDRGAAAPRP